MSSKEEVIEEQQPIDIDSLSDEELDSFIEEATGLDTEDMENSDVVEEEESTQEEESAQEEEDKSDEEEVSEDGLQEENQETEEEIESNEEEESSEDVPTIELDNYAPEELQTMTEVYEDLFKNGIKAAGVNRTVRDAEHLKTLVRIGLGANENNRKIKPYLKQLRSLEQAGISLEDDNLNFLVDIMNGNKDAIKELIKNKVKLDEEEIISWYDEEGNKDDIYIPNDHMMSDSRFQIEEILKEEEVTPTYEKLATFLNTVDDVGKKIINESPEIIKLINSDMQTGIYDKAMDEAQFRMDRGLLPKQSILQAYITVMQDEEFYNSLIGDNSQEVTNKISKPAPKKKEIIKRKKKASSVGTSNVSSNKGSTKQNTKDINKMSEEEFNDFFNSLDIDD